MVARQRFMETNRMFNVVLYTRDGCHLCEEAQEVLSEFGISPTIVDIDADLNLRERFDTCVPVVEIDGKIRFRGRVEPTLLRRIVRHGK
jgi:glutaredoxin